MNRALILAAVLIVTALIVVTSVFFTVREDQQAIVLRLGEPRKQIPAEEAGLKVKTPFIENVVYLDARNLEFDLDRPLEVIFADEERLNVDAFVRYRIVNPLLYFERLSGGGADARSMRDNFDGRMTEVISDAMREVLGDVQIRDIITERRAGLMSDIQTSVAEEMRVLGVEVVDLRIRQADFLDENTQNVYDRMISDYSQQAEALRAEGDRRATELRAAAEKEQVQIIAEAEEENQRIRGQADAEANAVFNAAYAKDPEFFAFYRSLNAYEQALRDDGTTIILSPDSEFFRYFGDLQGRQ